MKIEDCEYMVDTIQQKASDLLNAWEYEFIENMHLKIRFKQELTENEIFVLEKIFNSKIK